MGKALLRLPIIALRHERHGDDFGGGGLAAHDDLQLRAQRRQAGGHIGHGDVAAQGGGGTARGDLADHLAVRIGDLGAFAGGRLDDRIGPRRVILGSLLAMVLTAAALFLASGTTAFWIGGLVLCLFVGPVQSASRAFLGRVTTPRTAGEVFGLYATTGRAVGFITPALVSVALTVQPDNRAVIPVIGIVLVAGAALFAGVAEPGAAESGAAAPAAD